MRNRKIWIPLVPSGFYWLCNWINCFEYQSKQINCFLSDGNKNFLHDCRGYKRPPSVKNSFATGNYFLFRIFISKIKHELFSWSQKLKIFTWVTFLSFLRNIDISRNPSISCLLSQDASLLRIFRSFSNKFKRWKV